MGVVLINGDGNPAVYARQDADWYAALTGCKTTILRVNEEFAYETLSSNVIRIASGTLITKEGRRVQIDYGDVEEITIPTGTQGQDTYYIIGFRLFINELGSQVAETFCETMSDGTATIEELTFKGEASEVYISLYRVKKSGVSISSVNLIADKGGTIITESAHTGSGSTITNTIAKGTAIDEAIEILLDNDSALNSNLTVKTPITITSGNANVSANGYIRHNGFMHVFDAYIGTMNADIPIGTKIVTTGITNNVGNQSVLLVSLSSNASAPAYINSAGEIYNVEILPVNQTYYIVGSFLA